jgi:predicted nucleic acid-binding protein
VPVLLDALKIKGRYGISYWDAAIVAAARALGCGELCSEDKADGCDYEGTTVINPFR